MTQPSNPNIQAATTFVAALAQSGLRTVVISPGSRSTPLTLAFAAHPQIETILQLDERSAGFFALGRALKTDKPVAVVCTSGTAAANYFPAIIEAYMSHVPLLILTSDRPHELRHSGANQTIDQVNMFGNHVLHAADLAIPTADMPDLAWRNIATTAVRAYAIANGHRKGAVHINFPFRKPLQPQDAQAWLANQNETAVSPSPTATIQTGSIMPTHQQVETLTQLINENERGIIVCGPRCPGGDFPTAVSRLAQVAGYPIFADPISNVRFGTHVAHAPIVSGYETWLANSAQPDFDPPDVVIRFGAVPTSKWLNSYLAHIEPKARLHIRASGVWADDTHLTTDFWQVDETALCQLAQSLLARRPADWVTQTQAWETKSWEQLTAVMPTEPFDIPLFQQALGQLPEQANIFVGNSLPIRHFDQFARAQANNWRVFGNRGASGIDGLISTAIGIATADPDTPAVLIIGDVSFFHDMNGLLLAKDTPNLTILLFNNDGGGIFNRLPINQFEETFAKFFTTSHELDYRHAAELYGLTHTAVHTPIELNNALADSWLTAPRIIELFTDNGRDEQLRRQLITDFHAP